MILLRVQAALVTGERGSAERVSASREDRTVLVDKMERRPVLKARDVRLSVQSESYKLESLARQEPRSPVTPLHRLADIKPRS